MIDLAQNRTIVFRKGPPRLSVTVSPISKAAWLECLDAMTSIGAHVEAEEALMGLLEEVAIKVDGYPDTADDSNWISKIPWRHRTAYANALGSALLPEGSGPTVNRSVGETSIRLHSIWSARENGGLLSHKDLVHVFKAPSIQQLLNFRRGFSCPRVVKGGRRENGRGMIVQDPLAGRMCSALYDEFIVRVEGYAIDGEPLGDNRTAIVNGMDTYHKVIAAAALIVA